MAATTMVHVRVDEHIKTQASETWPRWVDRVGRHSRLPDARCRRPATSFRAQGAERWHSRRDERGACDEREGERAKVREFLATACRYQSSTDKWDLAWGA